MMNDCCIKSYSGDFSKGSYRLINITQLDNILETLLNLAIRGSGITPSSRQLFEMGVRSEVVQGNPVKTSYFIGENILLETSLFLSDRKYELGSIDFEYKIYYLGD